MYSVCVMSVASVSSLISWHPAKKEPTFRRTSHPLGTYITTPLKELSMFMMVSSASNVVFLRYVYVRPLEYGVQYDVPYRVESGVNRYETVICLVVDLIVRLSVPERGMVKGTFILFRADRIFPLQHDDQS
mgnify:CR=1 FL=1